MQKLFSPNFNYDELGIGGLNKEFMEIFRRAFATRYPLMPPDASMVQLPEPVRAAGCSRQLSSRIWASST